MAELQETEKADNDQQTSLPPAGEVLLAARLAKKLTQQDVSDYLRYSARQIDALEKGEYHLLPDAMIMRGFIRSYARLLEIDAEPLLASYRQSVSIEADKVLSVQTSMRPVPLSKENQPWHKYVLAGASALFLLLALLFYVDYMPKSSNTVVEKAPEVVAETVPAASEPLPEIALPAAQRQAESVAPASDYLTEPNAASSNAASKASSVNGATVSDAPVDMKSVDTKSADIKSQAQLSAQQAPVSVTAAVAKVTDKTVSMVFTAQSWVRVTDKSGKLVYEKISNNGDKETINSSLPLNLLIGNASGTKLNFGGKEIDLAPSTKNNVARVTLE